MNRYARWAFALTLLPLAACAPRRPPPPVTAPPPPRLSSADASFLDQAATINLAEIQEAQLAEHRAPRPTVRQFARQMITDHTRANQSLTALAQSKGVSVPTAPTQEQAAQLAELEHVRGRAFDRRYVEDQIMGHQQAIALYQGEAANGSDPEVRAYAQQTLPVLQQHLSMAQALQPTPVSHRRRRH